MIWQILVCNSAENKSLGAKGCPCLWSWRPIRAQWCMDLGNSRVCFSSCVWEYMYPSLHLSMEYELAPPPPAMEQSKLSLLPLLLSMTQYVAFPDQSPDLCGSFFFPSVCFHYETWKMTCHNTLPSKWLYFLASFSVNKFLLWLEIICSEN